MTQTKHLPCGCLVASLPPVILDRNGVWICLACTISRRQRARARLLTPISDEEARELRLVTREEIESAWVKVPPREERRYL